MKKTLLVVSILVVVLAALAVAGFAYAQRPTPQAPYGNGMMGWGRGGGMMGSGSYGPMHEYMEAALADAFGLTQEELEERLANGETAWTIAQEKGLSTQEFTTLMTEARDTALTAMVADGTITQEQADWMKQRMNTMQQNGYGFGSGAGTGYGAGSCPMGGGFGGGRRGPGGRWNQQP